MQMDQKQTSTTLRGQKVTWKGWASLIFLILCFSGVFAHQDNFLRAFDFTALLGQFGHAEGAKVSIQGTGGSGAREAFILALTMVPTTMMAQGLIEVCQHLGAITAAGSSSSPSSGCSSACPARWGWPSYPASPPPTWQPS